MAFYSVYHITGILFYNWIISRGAVLFSDIEMNYLLLLESWRNIQSWLLLGNVLLLIFLVFFFFFSLAGAILLQGRGELSRSKVQILLSLLLLILKKGSPFFLLLIGHLFGHVNSWAVSVFLRECWSVQWCYPSVTMQWPALPEGDASKILPSLVESLLCNSLQQRALAVPNYQWIKRHKGKGWTMYIIMN